MTSQGGPTAPGRKRSMMSQRNCDASEWEVGTKIDGRWEVGLNKEVRGRRWRWAPKHAGDWRFRLVPHPPGKIMLRVVSRRSSRRW